MSEIKTETKNAVLNWLANGETGLSSEVMAYWITFDIKKCICLHPCNIDEISRCARLLREAPELRLHLSKMADVSDIWGRFASHWDELEKLFIDEAGPGWGDWYWLTDVLAPKTYALMCKIIGGKP